MANTTFHFNNWKKPPPKLWRKLEDGLIMIIFPAIGGIIAGWPASNPQVQIKLGLLFTMLPALVKFAGKFLANGEEYAPAGSLRGDVTIYPLPTRGSFPTLGIKGIWFLDESTGEYFYWDGTTYKSGGFDRPTKPPPV